MSKRKTGKIPSVAVVIPAAGSGTRMGGAANKILMPMGSHPLLQNTISLFQDNPAIGRIIVVAREEDFYGLDKCFEDRSRWSKLGKWVAGGRERQDSVARGIFTLKEAPPGWVLIHDGARPLCSTQLVGKVLEALKQNSAVVPTLPIYDTVRRIAGEECEVLNRNTLFRTQTPQGFHWQLLTDVHEKARKEGLRSTDDAQLVEMAGKPLAFIKGEERNIKITTRQDLTLAEWLLLNPEWGLEN